MAISEAMKAALIPATVTVIVAIFNKAVDIENKKINKDVNYSDFKSFLKRWVMANILGMLLFHGLLMGLMQVLCISRWLPNKVVWGVSITLAWIIGTLLYINFFSTTPTIFTGFIIGILISFAEITATNPKALFRKVLVVLITTISWTMGILLLQNIGILLEDIVSGETKYIIGNIIAGGVIGILSSYNTFYLLSEVSSER